VVLAMVWSLITGLAGGWLVLSPWALGDQPGTGSWTAVTNAQVRTGTGLLLLAVVGLGLAVVEGVSALREGGVLVRRAPVTKGGETDTAARDPRSGGSPSEMDQALISLASALAADLNRDGRPGSSETARSVDTQREG
jgi:hypothetical protein